MTDEHNGKVWTVHDLVDRKNLLEEVIKEAFQFIMDDKPRKALDILRTAIYGKI